MKNVLFILLIFCSISQAQNKNYRPGFIINKDDKKIQCFIKDSKWLQYPDRVDYKLEENGKVFEANVKNTKAIVIPNIVKLIRARVSVDMSSDNLSRIDSNKEPIWRNKTVFLKAEIEGSANLYYLFIEGRKRYFFDIEKKKKKEQLVYKRYRSSSITIKENNHYKQRLMTLLKCDGLKHSDFLELKYKSSSLSKLFVNYNNCKGNLINDYNALRYEKDRLKVKLRSGINYSEMNINSQINSTLSANFGKKKGLHVGAEFELKLPFKKSKNWSLVLAPNYSEYEDATTIETSSINTPTQDLKINYNSIQIPIGLRHYLNLSKDFNLFIDGSIYIDWTTNLSLKYSITGEKSDTNTICSSVGVGLGLNYKKIDLMTVIRSSRDPFNISFESNYKQMSIVLAYRIL